MVLERRHKLSLTVLGLLLCEAFSKGLPTSDESRPHQIYSISKKFTRDPHLHSERIPLLNIRYEFEFPQIEALEPVLEEDRWSNRKPVDRIEDNSDYYYSDNQETIVDAPHVDPIAPSYDYAYSVDGFGDWGDVVTADIDDESGETRKKRHARTKCGGKIEDITGLIQTPDYPYNYENNIACTWIVETPINTTIAFACDDFDLQGGMACQNDYLEISQSGDPAFLDSTRYCYNDMPNIISSGNKLALRFVSNSFYRYRGFSCRFKALGADGLPLSSGYMAAPSTNDQLAPGCNSKALTGSDWSGRCGVPNAPSFYVAGQNRQVGATAVGANEYPWMVAMLKRCGDTKFGTRQYCLICGGTVVAPQWILTAAHCIQNRNLSDVGVLLGDQNLFTVDTTQKFSIIADVYLHPEFNIPSTLNNDLALVKLATPVQFSKFISPICLPKQASARSHEHRQRRQAGSSTGLPSQSTTTIPASSSPSTSTNASTESTTTPGSTSSPSTSTNTSTESTPASTYTSSAAPETTTSRNITSDWSLVGLAVKVLGWGVVDDLGHIADKLRAVDITVIDNNKCDYYYGIMTDNMMCTAGDGGRGPCGGDSGGPALQLQPDGSFVQVGILAFGAAAGCEVGYPSGQVLVSRYLDWIEFITKGEVFK